MMFTMPYMEGTEKSNDSLTLYPTVEAKFKPANSNGYTVYGMENFTG